MYVSIVMQINKIATFKIESISIFILDRINMWICIVRRSLIDNFLSSFRFVFFTNFLENFWYMHKISAKIIYSQAGCHPNVRPFTHGFGHFHYLLIQSSIFSFSSQPFSSLFYFMHEFIFYLLMWNLNSTTIGDWAPSLKTSISFE